MSTELTVKVDRVCYPKEGIEGDWYILSCMAGDTLVTAKGNMPWRPKQHERLKLTGDWKNYQGKREFSFKAAALDMPTGARELLHYVCEMTPGIGPALEEQIWELKGDAWAAIEEGEISRLRGRTYHAFMGALESAEADRAKGEVIAELLKAGCTMNMAAAAYEKWKDGTVGVIQSDPYRLTELAHYGFSDVDAKIRIYYGIGDGDPRRIRAAMIYVMKQLTEGGSTLVRWDILESQCLTKLGGYKDVILSCAKEMITEGSLKAFPSTRSIALASDYKNELIIWEYIQPETDW